MKEAVAVLRSGARWIYVELNTIGVELWILCFPLSFMGDCCIAFHFG
jgi:hypothetical protein